MPVVSCPFTIRCLMCPVFGPLVLWCRALCLLPDGEGRGSAGTKPSVPVLQKSPTPSSKGCRGRSKKARRQYCVRRFVVLISLCLSI